jgi:Xaa-Pro dipeptidase
MTFTPSTEIQSRIGKLQSLMADKGLGGVLIVQQLDLFYFTGTGQDAHLFIPTQGTPALMVRKSYERAVEESPLESIHPLKSLSDVKRAVESATGGSLGRLGMELDVLPVNNFRVYEQLFAGATIVDASPLIKAVRMIKSPYELALMREAACLNDGLFTLILTVLREGMTELEFSGLLEAYYRKNGHQGHVRVRSFNQEVFYGHIMSGPNLAVPSATVGPTGGPGVNPHKR